MRLANAHLKKNSVRKVSFKLRIIWLRKSEFEKIVQPAVLKRFWVNTLKKNYLSGAAFTPVEKCETMEEIWKKLQK